MEFDCLNSSPDPSLLSCVILGKSHLFPSLCLYLFYGDDIGPCVRFKEIILVICIVQCLALSRSVNISDPERLCGLSEVTQGRSTRFLVWADF